MPSERSARVVEELARRGYNADREAVTLLAGAADPESAAERAAETAPDDALVLSTEHVRDTLQADNDNTPGTEPAQRASDDPVVSSGDTDTKSHDDGGYSPVETQGSEGVKDTVSDDGTAPTTGPGGGDDAKTAHDSGIGHGDELGREGLAESGNESGREGRAESGNESGREGRAESGDEAGRRGGGRSGNASVEVSGDITSTGTGEYRDFVSVFRDRYERLAPLLKGRVNDRPAATVAGLSDGSETGLVGMVADRRFTSGGHLRLELEDRTGRYACIVMNDSPVIEEARTVLSDEVVGVEGDISRRQGDDEGVLFVDELYFPEIEHTHTPSTADRPVRAALVSDLHVGSEEFLADAWERFADWLHTPEAADVEYLLVGGDMVEGVGVYPGQDEELAVEDIYDQYERFSEHLKSVPGELEIVMIPGNHDAVRLAEPQPAFDDRLRSIMSAHDATITANPSVVELEGVSVLMYHGVSIDELVAELPGASYDEPAEAMTQLLRKRHLAPRYGGKTRIAPESDDHMVIDEVPDIFHAGHVHKFGYTDYRDVLTVNSSCWQAQTSFQERVNLDPDVAYAPIVDLETLNLRYAHFL